jgi:glycosyltransferase involved in cell wall biosynthesis
MPEVSLFIPAYNAEKHLDAVIGRIPAEVWPRIHTIWIINDGSTDATGTVIEDLKRHHAPIHSISFPKNRGYGQAVKAGLAACAEETTDFAVCLHSDGQYPPESLPAFLEAAKAGSYDILQGSRHAPGTARQGGMPLYKYLIGKALVALENRVFGLTLTDYHSGYLCYSRRALREIPFAKLSSSFDFDLEIIAAARVRGLRIGEIGIPTRYADEVSYLNPVTYGFRVLAVLVKYLAHGYR